MEKAHSKYKKVNYSLKDGLNFYFGDEDLAVQVKVKPLNNERIFFVNGNEIARQSGLSTFKKTSNETFRYLDSNFEVELYVESFISGRIRCTLIKDSAHFATLRFNPRTFEVEHKGLARVVKESLLGGLVGAVSGYALATLFIL